MSETTGQSMHTLITPTLAPAFIFLCLVAASGIIVVSVMLYNINEGVKKIMADLTQLTNSVARQRTVTDSAVTLIKGLAARVATLPPDQSAIDELATQILNETTDLAAAVTDNPPANGVVPLTSNRTIAQPVSVTRNADGSVVRNADSSVARNADGSVATSASDVVRNADGSVSVPTGSTVAVVPTTDSFPK